MSLHELFTSCGRHFLQPLLSCQQFGFARGNGSANVIENGFLHLRTQSGVPGPRRQLDRFNLKCSLRQKGRYSRSNRTAVFHAIAFVTASVEPGRGRGVLIEDAHHPQTLDFTAAPVDILLEGAGIGLAGQAVLPDINRFKEGPQFEVVIVLDGIIFMIVAVSTIECQPEKGFTCVFDRAAHPVIGIQ